LGRRSNLATVIEPDTLERYLSTLKTPEGNSLAILLRALKFKDPYTFYHSRRVASLATLVCYEMQLHPQVARSIILAALAHDIGKISTPDRILKKPGRLTRDEFLIMKNHPAPSVEMLEPFKEFAEVLPSIRHHHERIDGFGYPDGIKGEEIPLGARIILVVDTYDAMTSDRSYRKGCGPEIALAELKECTGSQFDAEIVGQFTNGIQALTQEGLDQIDVFIDKICQI